MQPHFALYIIYSWARAEEYTILYILFFEKNKGAVPPYLVAMQAIITIISHTSRAITKIVKRNPTPKMIGRKQSHRGQERTPQAWRMMRAIEVRRQRVPSPMLPEVAVVFVVSFIVVISFAFLDGSIIHNWFEIVKHFFKIYYIFARPGKIVYYLR